jgi:hypothetical protein
LKVIIDRFEGDYAVCETEERNMINIERSSIPLYAKEGDVLKISEDSITVDTLETAKEKNDADTMVDDLWK